MEETMDDVIETYLPDNECISEFHSLSLENKQRVIRLGLFVYKEGANKLQGWDNEDWQKKIDEINKAHEIAIKQAGKQYESLQQSFDKYKKYATEQQTICIEGAVMGERTKYDMQIKSLTETNSDLLSKLNSLQSEVEQRYAQRFETLIANHQKILMDERDKRDSMRQDYESKLQRQQNSSLKGKDGEGMVYSRLNMMFPTADVEDTHTIPHRGDFILRVEGMTVMIETKNYSRNVQKAEIDKFYSDIDNPANSDIEAAVFVSLHTGICNRDDFQFEVRNGTPLIFIHNLVNNFDSIKLALSFFKMISDQGKIDFSHKETIDAFKNLASGIKRNFQKQKTTLDRYYTSQMELITLQQSNISELYGVVKQKF
tara:strand:+ start:1667 stop:2779 length:1113 start_codon:yes stop_codon:yes gene_type:complete